VSHFDINLQASKPTLTHSNHLGGFFARLEASRKYIFGAASVYGAANDSVIQGAFMVRGNEALPAFDVAPDYESYEFTKLDPSKKEDKVGASRSWLNSSPNMPSRNMSRTSGAGTSLSSSKEKSIHGLTAKSSSRAKTRYCVWRL
jgi:hypothetical protein